MWWDRAATRARARRSAGAVYAPVGLATHYHTPQIHPYWADSLDTVGTIGAHRFYRWRGAAGRAGGVQRSSTSAASPHAAPPARLADTPPRSIETDPLGARARLRGRQRHRAAAASRASRRPPTQPRSRPAADEPRSYDGAGRSRAGQVRDRIRPQRASGLSSPDHGLAR